MRYRAATQTALRKMGNSSAMIVPRSILSEIGLSIGAAFDLRVEDGRLIGTPVATAGRAGWAEAAAAVAEAETPEEAEWRGMAAEGDHDLTW